MRKIKDVLRLHFELNLGRRQIGRSLNLPHSTVGDYIGRAECAGIAWPLPKGLSDGQLEQKLFPPAPVVSDQGRPLPVWADIHRELKRKGVTLSLLWEEYQALHSDGYQYSRFCDLYREWTGKLTLSMRQIHKAGEKLFVDYAGHTLPIVDRRTGEIREAQIFVAVLGASNYTFAEATWTQSLPDWTGSHVRALNFFGGAPQIIVPDNLKSGVTRPDRYEPDVNPTYNDLATHYGVAVIPARVRKPKDKAKAEVAVQIVERWILARLRNRTFFSLAEANAEIIRLLESLNSHPFKKLTGSRSEAFEALDQPALRPLPTTAFEFAEWKKSRVNIDYHIEVAKHYYSVPYQLLKQQLDVRLSATTVECFHKSKRVASHPRSSREGGHSTLTEHMPKAHQEYAGWDVKRLIDWAAKTGPETAALVEKILASRTHPQQGFRSALGLLRLGKTYGQQRLEAACTRAISGEACSYKSVASILKTGLDRQPLPEPKTVIEPVVHRNIRGTAYYH
ncbi:MAG: IS21 family transposase [Desulfuromonadales bacterium]|nr:IS21 family transposase [Desulfuromonadales bacterium]